MPQVGGRTVVEKLRRVASAQAAVQVAARQAADQVAADRAAELGQLEQARIPGQALEVPALPGTNGPSQGE